MSSWPPGYLIPSILGGGGGVGVLGVIAGGGGGVGGIPTGGGGGGVVGSAISGGGSYCGGGGVGTNCVATLAT